MEEGRRLAENVSKEHVSQIADDTLSDVGHQVAGQIGCNAFREVHAEDRGGDRKQIRAAR
jgi:hypothetical protein